MSEFQREYRYLVLKNSDLDHIPASLHDQLLDVIGACTQHRIDAGKQPLECVVVESDWPEYEIVWAMLEKRMAQEPAP